MASVEIGNTEPIIIIEVEIAKRLVVVLAQSGIDLTAVLSDHIHLKSPNLTRAARNQLTGIYRHGIDECHALLNIFIDKLERL